MSRSIHIIDETEILYIQVQIQLPNQKQQNHTSLNIIHILKKIKKDFGISTQKEHRCDGRCNRVQVAERNPVSSESPLP